ncbi:MAG: hypothetical protein VW879_13830 [Opitutae bacterium]
MRVLAATAVVTLAVGIIISATYDNVPEYKNWGADDRDNPNGCTCSHHRPDEISHTSAINEPASALSSILFFVAAIDNNAAAVFGGLLAAASLMLHVNGEEDARQLDFYTASAAPAVLAFIAVPPLSGLVLGAALVIGYETDLGHMELALIAAVIAAGGAFYYKIDRYHLTGVALTIGAAVLLHGGDKHSATCSNDTDLALALDLRHFGWHLSVSILMWLGVGVFGNVPRDRPVLTAATTLIPLISRLTDLDQIYLASWLTTTIAAVMALAVLAATDKRDYELLNPFI